MTSLALAKGNDIDAQAHNGLQSGALPYLPLERTLFETASASQTRPMTAAVLSRLAVSSLWDIELTVFDLSMETHDGLTMGAGLGLACSMCT